MHFTELMNRSVNAADFTMESMKRSIKAMEWLKYEVDPEWARFCSFGPEDIGGPWEKLGIIRKRPQYNAVMLDPAMRRQLEWPAKPDNAYFGFDPGSPLEGLKVIDSPPGMNFLVRMDYQPILPSRHMIFKAQ